MPRERGAVAAVTRAAIAFRQGFPVAIAASDGTCVCHALETLTPAALAEVKGRTLVLTHARARTLKIPLYTDNAVALQLSSGARLENLLAVADPTFDLAAPLKGPFTPVRETLPLAFAASIQLAKLAGLLPVTVCTRVAQAPSGAISILASDVHDYETETVETLTPVTRAHVPLQGAEDTELVAFRARDGGPEHYAILIHAPPPHKPVLARVHSECFTGDLLGSLKCDCGPQLRGAIETIAKSGGGVVLYLAQEGRGIGLINKLRAYRLQDQGFDTLQANERLGFEADERFYRVAAKMLSMLGYLSVRLLTNNPAKVKALQDAGIDIIERVPHRFPGTAYSRDYLRAKAKAGHLV